MTIEEFIELAYASQRVGSLSRYPIYKQIIDMTNFLESDAKVHQRIWHIKNNILTIPHCKMCDNLVNWDRGTKQYRTYCSSKCMNSDPIMVDKIKQSNLEKYGVDNPQKSKEIRKKVVATNLEKYGSVAPMGNIDIKNKSKETCISKYGVDNPQKSKEIRQKTNLTKLDRYGDENYTNRDKWKETCLERFGGHNWSSGTESREKYYKTIQEKYNRRNPKQVHISLDTLSKLQDRDWLYGQNHGNGKNLEQIGQGLGVYGTTVGFYFRKYNIPLIKKIVSVGEKEIVDFLTSNNIRVDENRRDLISPYELDIYLPEYNLAIEYCGIYFHSSKFKPKNYHRNKYELCKEKGIRLLTIYDDEWIYKSDIIKSKILNICHKDNTNRIYARNTEIIRVENKYKNLFFDKTHIQGTTNSTVCYGLIYDDELVACMSFLKIKDIWEINRYSTVGNVIGGFSKLLKYFIRNHKFDVIVSFADLRMSQGGLYYKNGFKLVNEIGTTFDIIADKKRLHRRLFQKKMLINKLDSYDNRLTEEQNCENHGIYRIYNCGLLKFEFRN